MTYIARKKCEHPVLISEIAKSENISQKFLESILLTLRKAGILGAKKGKGGGYYLLKEALIWIIVKTINRQISMRVSLAIMHYQSEETVMEKPLKIK